MSILRQLGTNSTIYAATSVLQRGLQFLLLPLYTHYLAPSAYGVLAIVTAVNGVLSIFFTLGLTSAVTRFYFEYQDQPALLARFWGTILVFVMALSVALAGLLLLVGETLLRPLIGAVPFWPFVALGVMATFFQPFFLTFLAILQMRNQALRYAAVSLANFGLTAALTLFLVVQLGWGARGPLAATLAASVVFFAVSLWMLRDNLRLCLDWGHLTQALRYSLPLVPHSVSAQLTAFSDRLVLNHYLGTASTGLYSVGAMLALIVEVGAQSVNRAYVPLTMAALKRGSADDMDQIRTVGTLFVGVFCMLGTAVAALAPELLMLLASPAYAAAAAIVPLLVFAGVANAFYFLFVNILFYDRRAVRMIPLGTASAAVISVGLLLLLVPAFGMTGAAWAALASQILATVLIAIIARKYEPVRWPYGRYALAFALALGMALALGAVNGLGAPAALALKLAALGLLSVGLGALLWGQPWLPLQALGTLLRGRPASAAALFSGAEGKA
jgi:O-antigen/teichoic acid export membrane protein